MTTIIKKKNLTIFNSKNIYLSNNLMFRELKKKILSKNNIYLSGGKSLDLLLNKINKEKKILASFFLTDERLSNKREKKNIFNIKKRVKMKIIKFDYSLYENLNKLKLYCNKNLPNPDIAFIGIGEDGHVASIFNYKKCKENFFLYKKRSENFYRISISEKMLLKSNQINIFINKKRKNFFFSQLVNSNINGISSIPIVRICKKFKGKINIYTHNFV
jgi:6-phosphogluconolactonase/glucosamine-6-phosphate isomerase/deaminase